MAPERFSDEALHAMVVGSSEGGDVYSLAMTSFSVCTPFGKPFYRLKQPSCCNQVLTGALPYHRDDRIKITASIRGGERPSRPTGPSQIRLLQDPVWDVIVTGWSHEREKRCEISLMHDTFVTASQEGVYSGDLDNWSDGNLMITKTSQKPKQGDSNMGKSPHQPLLPSSFCKTRSQKSRGRLMK